MIKNTSSFDISRHAFIDIRVWRESSIDIEIATISKLFEIVYIKLHLSKIVEVLVVHVREWFCWLAAVAFTGHVEEMVFVDGCKYEFFIIVY